MCPVWGTETFEASAGCARELAPPAATFFGPLRGRNKKRGLLLRVAPAKGVGCRANALSEFWNRLPDHRAGSRSSDSVSWSGCDIAWSTRTAFGVRSNGAYRGWRPRSKPRGLHPRLLNVEPFGLKSGRASAEVVGRDA